MSTMIEKAKTETGQNMVLAALQRKFKKIPEETEESVLAMSARLR